MVHTHTESPINHKSSGVEQLVMIRTESNAIPDIITAFKLAHRNDVGALDNLQLKPAECAGEIELLPNSGSESGIPLCAGRRNATPLAFNVLLQFGGTSSWLAVDCPQPAPLGACPAFAPRHELLLDSPRMEGWETMLD